MDISKAWRDAMSMIGAHREALLVFAGLFLLVPQLLLTTMVPAPDMEGATPQEMLTLYSDYFRDAGLWMLLTAVVTSFGGLLIYDRLLGRGARTVAESFAPALALLLPFLAASILSGLLIVGGLFLFIVPGLWLSAKFALIGPVMVGEGTRSPVGALGRSWQITGSYSWSILLMVIVISIVWFVAWTAVTTVVSTLVAALVSPDVALAVQNFLDAFFGTALSLIFAALYSAIWRQLATPAAA